VEVAAVEREGGCWSGRENNQRKTMSGTSLFRRLWWCRRERSATPLALSPPKYTPADGEEGERSEERGKQRGKRGEVEEGERAGAAESKCLFANQRAPLVAPQRLRRRPPSHPAGRGAPREGKRDITAAVEEEKADVLVPGEPLATAALAAGALLVVNVFPRSYPEVT